MTLKLAFAAVLALSGAAAHAQQAGAPETAAPTSPGEATALPGITVEPKSTLPNAPCPVADRACYAAVAKVLKTRFPDVYWKLAQKCMQEEMQDARRHANPLVDDSASAQPPTAGGSAVAGDIAPQNAGERTFCAIAQSDAKPPPSRKR